MDGNTCSLLELGNSENLEFAMDGRSVTYRQISKIPRSEKFPRLRAARLLEISTARVLETSVKIKHPLI